jgi:hypothetical protein
MNNDYLSELLKSRGLTTPEEDMLPVNPNEGTEIPFRAPTPVYEDRTPAAIPEPELPPASEGVSSAPQMRQISMPKFDSLSGDRKALLDQLNQLRQGNPEIDKAQSDLKRDQSMSMILGGLNKVGAGYAGTAGVSNPTVDNSYLDTMVENTKGDLGLAQTNRKQKLEDLMTNYKLVSDQAKENRADANQKFNMDYKNAMLQSRNNEMTEYQRARLQQAKDNLELRKLQFGDKQEEDDIKRAILSDKQVETINNLDQAQYLTDQIKMDKKDVDTGPLAGRLNTAARFIGIDDPKTSGFRAKVMDSLAERIKFLSGTAVNEAEAQRLLESIPNMNDNDKTFSQKLKNVDEKLKEHRKTFLDNIEKKGRDVTKFRDAPSQEAGDPRVKAFMSKNNITDESKAIEILKKAGKL